MPKHLEISNFEQLLKHILRVFPSLGGKVNFVGLDHSGSQPFKYISQVPTAVNLCNVVTLRPAICGRINI